MSKLSEIASGFFNMLSPNKPEEYREVYAKRMEICNSCPFNKRGTCKKCGCVLKMKVCSDKTSCPEGKWRPISKNNKTITDDGLN